MTELPDPFEIPDYIGTARLAPTKGPERILFELKSQIKPITNLKLWPDNARQGDIPFVATSLAENAQFRPIMVQRSSDQVVYGNHTLRAARELLLWTRLAWFYSDLTDDDARRIAIVDNYASDQAGWDNALLVAELQRLPDLTGTGFAQPDLDQLRHQLEGAQRAAGPISTPSLGHEDDARVTCPECQHRFTP